jgi:hypothetical protein
MYISQQFSPGSDFDRADRLLVAVSLLLTDVRCNTSAKTWFLEQFETLRSEAKAQIRQQMEPYQLRHLFGPKEVKPTPDAPTTQARRGRGRPRKTKAPPVSPEPFSQLKALFKPQPMSPECQRLLAPLFRPAPTTPTSSSANKPTKVDESSETQRAMRQQLSGLFNKGGNR